jgi:hypothetical protein
MSFEVAMLWKLFSMCVHVHVLVLDFQDLRIRVLSVPF